MGDFLKFTLRRSHRGLRHFIVLSLIFTGAAHSQDRDSICYGTTADGRLEHGVRLPDTGANFTSYSQVASALGRTYVHSLVHTIVVDTYERLRLELPDKVYSQSFFQE